jgi:hypothetical protein
VGRATDASTCSTRSPGFFDTNRYECKCDSQTLMDTGLSRLNYRIEPIDCFSLTLIESLFDLAGIGLGARILSARNCDQRRAMVFQGIEGAQRISCQIQILCCLSTKLSPGTARPEAAEECRLTHSGLRSPFQRALKQLRVNFSDKLGNSMPLGVAQCESQD